MNWDSPEERFRLADRVGPEEYNRQHAAHLAASVLETVNGYPLRPVACRFGRLIAVGGTNAAFSDLDSARRHAESLPPNQPEPSSG